MNAEKANKQIKRAGHLRQARDRGKHTNGEINAQRCEVHMWRNIRQPLGTWNAPRTSFGGRGYGLWRTMRCVRERKRKTNQSGQHIRTLNTNGNDHHVQTTATWTWTRRKGGFHGFLVSGAVLCRAVVVVDCLSLHPSSLLYVHLLLSSLPPVSLLSGY